MDGEKPDLHRPINERNRTPSIGDYEDFTRMALSPTDLEELVGDGGQCVLNWSTSRGHPMGVVMAYVYRHGSFWTNCTATRKRVVALRSRPNASIVVSGGGKMATYKGEVVIHSSSDKDWDHIKQWFYAALSGADREPDNPFLGKLAAFLDSPNQVILETPATLVVSFDFAKFTSILQAAIAGAGPQ